MKRTRNVRPSLEVLEDRTTPSATVSVTNGNLVVAGSGTDVSIQALGNNRYSVSHDNVTTMAQGVTGDVRVNLAADPGGNNVAIDLQGFRVGKNLIVNTGSGDDTVTVENGTVGLDVVINTRGGDDTVTLGDGTSKLRIGGNVSVSDGPSVGDSLTVNGNVTIGKNLNNQVGNQLLLAQGAKVGGGLIFRGGAIGYDVTIAGSVGGSVWFFGASRSGFTSQFTLAATASVGQDVTAYSTSVYPFYDGSGNTFDFDGHIGNNLYLQSNGASDTVTFDTDLTVGGTAYVYLGGSNDTFNYNTPANRHITGYIYGGYAGYGSNTFNGDANRPRSVVRVGFATVNP